MCQSKERKRSVGSVVLFRNTNKFVDFDTICTHIMPFIYLNSIEIPLDWRPFLMCTFEA